MSWSREQVLEFLSETPRVGRLATVSADGEPHVVPVWFRVRDGVIQVHTSAETRKGQNVEATGRHAFTVDVDTLPYKGVTVRGAARAVDADVVDWSELIGDLAVAYAGPEAGAAMAAGIRAMPGRHVTLLLEIDDYEAWDYSR
jgi:PPOX class probable F420-dependent enzyme